MHSVVILSLVAVTLGASLPSNYGSSGEVLGPIRNSQSNSGYGSSSSQSCGAGRIFHNGACVKARVRQNIYLYEAPQRQYVPGPPPVLPEPKIERNVVFIRTPEFLLEQEPIVIPPTQRQTVVYVLSKNQEQDQQIIEIPDIVQPTPEVYYVNYNDGENPSLPGGISLQDALATANLQTGTSVGSSGGFSSGAPAFSSGSGGFSGGFGGQSDENGSFEDFGAGGFISTGSNGGSYSPPPSQTYNN